MFKPKAIVRMIALAALLFVAAACGSGGSGSGDSGKSGPKYVAISYPGLNVTIWTDSIKLMKPILKKAGYELLTDDPQWDAQRQVADWQAWIQRGDVKAIIGMPVQADSLVPVTKQANDAKIPIISYISSWDGAKTGLVVDNYEDGKAVGAKAAEWINANTDGNVEVAVLTYRDNDLGLKRSDGILDGLKAASKAKVYEVGGTLTRRQGYDNAKRQLSAHPNTTIWVSISSDQALGAYRALLDSGVKPGAGSKYWIGSLDVTPEVLKYVAVPNSIYHMSLLYTAEAVAKANSALLIAGAEGKKVEAQHLTPLELNADNVQKYLAESKSQ